jgi:hypothetical protein
MIDKSTKKVICDFMLKNYHLMSLQEMVDTLRKVLLIDICIGTIRNMMPEIKRKVGRRKKKL